MFACDVPTPNPDVGYEEIEGCVIVSPVELGWAYLRWSNRRLFHPFRPHASVMQNGNLALLVRGWFWA